MGRIVGMENITRYLGLSESTVMDKIQNQGLPAKKDEKKNIWEVDQARLDRWLADPQRDAKMAAVTEKVKIKDAVDAEISKPQTESKKTSSKRGRRGGRKK